jgi:hypothetical protein
MLSQETAALRKLIETTVFSGDSAALIRPPERRKAAFVVGGGNARFRLAGAAANLVNPNDAACHGE